MEDIYVWIIGALVTGFGGFYGSLVGGGGLLVMPTLLALGIDPLIALGSRRVSVIGGGTSAFIQFHRWKKIDYGVSKSLVLATFIGIGLGFMFVEKISADMLKRIIAIVILGLLFFMIFEDQHHIRRAKKSLFKRRHWLGPLLAVGSGMVSIVAGGGSATVLTYILILVYGKKMLEAAGTRKIPLFTGMFLGAGLFIWKGYVDWPLALIMFVGHMIGCWFGSAFYLKKGEEKVKPFFYAIVFILAIKVLLF